MKFEDLDFKAVKAFPFGIQAMTVVGKYKISVVQNSASYGNQRGLYEMGFIDRDTGDMVEAPGITNGDTVVGFLTEDRVTQILKYLEQHSETGNGTE